VPTHLPTSVPTVSPTDMPSNSPTAEPTDSPTGIPSDSPTDVPTDLPTDAPSDMPTGFPTNLPTHVPTDSPTDVPTDLPITSEVSAWYKGGAFDITAGTWPDASGGGNDATLSGSGLTELFESGHGASGEVSSLAGTTLSRISFGDVIKAQFTVCSVTRWTGGVNERILDGGGKNWLHGHWGGQAGVAHYDAWKTASSSSISPVTDWLVMCGTNAGSQLKLANGVDVGTATGGGGGVSLWVNAASEDEPSNFAIAEVVVWDRGLACDEMVEASSHLMEKFHLTAPGLMRPKIRKVRVQLRGHNFLQVAEVEVYDVLGNNVALSSCAGAYQSSNYEHAYPASRAINGNMNDFQHTLNEQGAWWEVNLGASYAISKVEVRNRQDYGGDRLSNSDILLLANDDTEIASYHIAEATTNQHFDIPASSFDWDS